MKLNSSKTIITLNPTKLLLGMLLFCGLLTGVVPQTVVDIMVVAICVMLLINGNLVLAYPFMLFYYGTFGLVLGLSTYRIFSLLLLIDGLLKLGRKANVQLKLLVTILVYVLYLIIVMSSYSLQRTVFCFIDILCVLFVAGYLNENTDNIREFFKLYALVSMVAIVSGIILQNALVTELVMEDYTASRFTATFEDPNYMGLFMTIGVFTTVTLKLFKPIVRWLAIIAMYAAILASASMTAIVVHILLWPVCLVVAKKINIKVFIACIVVILLVLGLYQYGLENPEAPIVGNVSFRIQEKLADWEAGDISGVTTKRSDLTKEHWEYFVEQPFWKKLFGGTPVNAIFISDDVYGAAHNEYVDLLLNVGLIGTAILLWFMFSNTYKHLKASRETGDETLLCIFMTKCVWIAYAATLTLFMDFRFMLPFFI